MVYTHFLSFGGRASSAPEELHTISGRLYVCVYMLEIVCIRASECVQVQLKLGFSLSLGLNHLLDWSISVMTFSISKGVIVGPQNLQTSPLLLTRNLVKFHGICLEQPFLGLCSSDFVRKNWYIGWGLGPFTSTLEKSGNVTPYLLVTNSFIFSESQGSCDKNQLLGKASISSPWSLYLLYNQTNYWQDVLVNPHLHATFVTKIHFFSLSWLIGKSFPSMSLTIMSKKFCGFPLIRSWPFLKNTCPMPSEL